MCPNRIQDAMLPIWRKSFIEFTLFQPKLETMNAFDENDKVGATEKRLANGEGKKNKQLAHKHNEKTILTWKFWAAVTALRLHLHPIHPPTLNHLTGTSIVFAASYFQFCSILKTFTSIVYTVQNFLVIF